MNTYLVHIPYQNNKNAAAFYDVLTQLHETVQGEKISFEILATGQNINFCFSGEQDICEIVAGQIYAVAPDSDIVEYPDFTTNIEQFPKSAFLEVELRRSDLFPLKMYPEFDGDSLSGILSVLAQCSPDENVWVQYVLAPVKDTAFHHFKLNLIKKFEHFFRRFRVKYWFKKGIAKNFDEKIKEKTDARLFHSSIRLGVLSRNPQFNVETRLSAVYGAMCNFSTLDFNQIGVLKKYSDARGAVNFQKRTLLYPYLLSARELATLYHLPNEKEVPNILHVLSNKKPPPKELPCDPNDSNISFFGATNFRGQLVNFGIKRSDRRRHFYTLGKSGSGKSKLLELLIRNDLEQGKGVGVLDPHGDLVDNILRSVPENRVKDIILFDPSDLQFPIAFNPLEQVADEYKMRVTIGFIEIFKKLFGNNWSSRIEHVLRYTTLALLDTPGTTMLSILKILSDKTYRQSIVRNIKDNVVKNFWVNEFAGWSEKFDNEAITPLLNKVGQFVSTNMIRNIVGQPKNLVTLRDVMDEKKIFLVKLSKGLLGEENAQILGAMIITKIYQAAMSRADILEDKRIDFYLYVDEFQNFATESFDEILSEARKYRLNLTLANQFLGQLDERTRKTVFGNVGSMLTFRAGGEDANLLANEFSPRFSPRDIMNLSIRDFVTKISIDGEIREAFSGKTMFIDYPNANHAQECISYSRKHYATPLHEVNQILKKWEEGSVDELNKKADGAGGGMEEEADFEEPLV